MLRNGRYGSLQTRHVQNLLLVAQWNHANLKLHHLRNLHQENVQAPENQRHPLLPFPPPPKKLKS